MRRTDLLDIQGDGLIAGAHKTVGDFTAKSDVMNNELKASGAIAEMAGIFADPATEVWFTTSGFNWKGKDPNTQVTLPPQWRPC